MGCLMRRIALFWLIPHNILFWVFLIVCIAVFVIVLMNVYVNVLLKSANWQMVSVLRSIALFSLIHQSSQFWICLICICNCIYICVSTSFSSGCPKKNTLREIFKNKLVVRLALKYHMGLFLRNFRGVIFWYSLMCIHIYINVLLKSALTIGSS